MKLEIYSLKLKSEEFQAKLEEANLASILREQTLRQEIVKANADKDRAIQREEQANLASILREQKLKQEIVKADDKFKECQLKAFNTNTKMELINLKMFQHLRDHDIDLTTNDYHSKLSTIETSFVSSKSACESVFHDNLTNILFKSMDTNSVNNCYLCSEFKQYSNKLLNQSDFIESEC
jgi:hypothetical protein